MVDVRSWHSGEMDIRRANQQTRSVKHLFFLMLLSLVGKKEIRQFQFAQSLLSLQTNLHLQESQ